MVKENKENCKHKDALEEFENYMCEIDSIDCKCGKKINFFDLYAREIKDVKKSIIRYMKRIENKEAPCCCDYEQGKKTCLCDFHKLLVKLEKEVRR